MLLSMIPHHKHRNKTNTDGTVNLPPVPNAVIVLCALLLAFGSLAVVMLLCKHLAPSGVYVSNFFAGYKRVKRDERRSPNGDTMLEDEEPLDPRSFDKRQDARWVERLINVLVFFSADNINDADLIIPVSEAEKLGTVEV
jgi:hypothetical protein